jgi:hypothetical protein
MDLFQTDRGEFYSGCKLPEVLLRKRQEPVDLQARWLSPLEKLRVNQSQAFAPLNPLLQLVFI